MAVKQLIIETIFPTSHIEINLRCTPATTISIGGPGVITPNSQAAIASLVRRLSVTLFLYFIQLFTAIFLSHAMAVKRYNDDVDSEKIISLFTKKYIGQMYSNGTCLNISTSKVAESGIVTVPVRRSVTAMLHNKIFERFSSSLLFFKATITKELKRTVKGQVINIMATNIQEKVVLFKSALGFKRSGHKNTDMC